MAAVESSRVFVPARILEMPPERRRHLFVVRDDPEAFIRWVARERALCADPVTGFMFWLEGYGSLEPPIGGPQPFYPWEAQREAAADICDLSVSVVVVVKARRLGLSWLALHYALWIAMFAPYGPGSRIAIICKNEDDAGKLLARIKRIIERLPPWLRPTLTTANTETLAFAETGAEISSLPATEGAARMETATLLLLDEFAFPRDGKARGIWRAAKPTIEGGGRAIVISTGNGENGDGAQFAWLVRKAERGELPGGRLVFLGVWARPDRTMEWYRAERENYVAAEDFEAEYPETTDQALASATSPTVYPTRGIVAAEKIGAILAEETPDLIDGGVEIGGDWGDFQTFAAYAVPLAGGSAWVCDEKILMRVAPDDASDRILGHYPADRSAGIVRTSFDSAPIGNNKIFAGKLRAYHRSQPASYPDQHEIVTFSSSKEGGSGKRGTNTVAYIAMLLRRSAALWERIEHMSADQQVTEILRAQRILAISPRCVVLLHQMRELRRDGAGGRVLKPVLSPSDAKAGDHGPDALVALFAQRARAYRPERRELEPAA